MPIQPPVNLLKKGDRVDHFFILKKTDLRLTKTNKRYLVLEFGDKTLSIQCNVWDNFDDIQKNFAPGDLVKVEGTIDEFMGSPQVKLSAIRSVNSADNVSYTDFLGKSRRDPSEMRREFQTRIDCIKDKDLKSLMQLIFNEDNMRKFSNAPAGKSWHHSYIHGLIEHTLEIIKICDLMCDIHPDINRDLLIAGAMMHDFGKIEEIKFESSFEYSDKGKLIGHIVLSAFTIQEYTSKIPSFPEEIKNCLLHIVLSHQGKLEYASPVVPKTVEAIALYQADELSAKINAYKGAISSDGNNGSKWTKYLSLISTDLYKYTLSPETSEEKINNTLFDK
jgi:3'-5' exoribonuclease